MIFTRKANLLLGVSIALVAPASAFAQDAPQPASPPKQQASAAAGSSDEEIVVTARRREESIQTVPVSVSAFSSETLVSQGITDTSDLQRLVPGVVFAGSGTPANTTFYIRGQGKDVIGPGLPSVISYFNEVPLTAWGSILPAFDISNVQVLKGPQGTLFGRNTTGGAVLVYSAKPTYDFEGYVEASAGEYFMHGLEGAINIPIVKDAVSLRLAGQYQKRDGYTKNLGVGGDLDDINNRAFRASLLIEPSSHISNTTVFDYFKSDTAGPGQIPQYSVPAGPGLRPFYHDLPDRQLAGGAAQATAGGNQLIAAGQAQIAAGNVPQGQALIAQGTALLTQAGQLTFTKNVINAGFNCGVSVDCDIDLQLARQRANGPRTVYSDIAPSARSVVWGVSNTTTLDLGPVSFKNIFGYRRTENHVISNIDGLGLAALNADNYRNDEQYSDEIQFSGTLWDDRVNFLLGGFYLKSNPLKQNGLKIDLFSIPANRVPAPFAPFLPNGFPGLSGYTNSFYGDESKALFGNLTVEIVQGLKLNGGYRYTWDKASLCAVAYAPGTGSFLADVDTCKATAGAFVDSVKFSAPTWSVGLDYQATDKVFAYGVVRRGYRTGNLNSPMLSTTGTRPLAAFQSYDPQFVTDYEVGIKTNWRAGDAHGRFNVAAFQGNFSNLQNQVATIPANFDGDNNNANDPAGTALVVNAGKARIRGVEFEGGMGVGGLNLSFGAAYLEAKYTEYSLPATFSSLPSSAPKIYNTPKWSYNVGGTYDLPFELSGATFRVGADFYHIDTREVSLTILPGYDLANARIEINNIGGEQVDFTFFVNNVFDKAYLTNTGLTGVQPGMIVASYGPPRTYGARLRYSF